MAGAASAAPALKLDLPLRNILRPKNGLDKGVHFRAIPTGKLNRRYGEQRAHLVLKVGERVIQPVEKKMIVKSDQSAPMAVLGTQEGKITLDFAFDVIADDLQSPVQVILIDGDGNKHQEKADLKGILDID